jgi:hypothetical protein
MDLLGTLADAGTSAMSGGLFGLIGHVATKLVGYFEAEQQFKQKQAEWSHETELLKLQMQAKAEETEHEIDLATATGSWAGLGESLKAEAAIGATYPWVNAVRALVRPALTFGLALFLCAAFLAMTPGEATRAYIANSLVFAAVTAIVWWFGDRAPTRASK